VLTTSSTDLENPKAFEGSENVNNLTEKALSAQDDVIESNSKVYMSFIYKVVDTTQGQVKYKLVIFREGDPENPKNWPLWRKWTITMIIGWICFAVAFASAVITPGIQLMSVDLGVSTEVGLLSITLFVFGFGVGREVSPSLS